MRAKEYQGHGMFASCQHTDEELTKARAALRQRDERIAALVKALENLCDSIEAAGGHDENGDVFDLTEAIAALEASK